MLGEKSYKVSNPMPLRFSIRDLLWLTAVIGMAVGWFMDRNGLTFERYQEPYWIIGFVCGFCFGYAYTKRAKPTGTP